MSELELIAQALTNQRTYMLAMANTNLTPYQSNALGLLYLQNRAIVNLLGIRIPELAELVQYFNEVAYLEDLYRRSGDEESEGEGKSNPKEENVEGSGGSAGMDGTEIGSDEAP
jgi:hypothetical protein